MSSYDINLDASGIEDINATGANIVVSPTITPDVVNVRCDAGIQAVRLFDTTGRCLEATKYDDISHATVNLSGYPYSVYLIEVTSSQGVRKVQRVFHSPNAF